jgi:hypothetical protein
MFGFTARSKSTASLLSVAVLASAMLAPAALAAPFSAGNSFEIPIVPHDRMDQTSTIASQTLWGGNADEIPLVMHRGAPRAFYGSPRVMWGGNADEIPFVTPGTARVPTHVVSNARARQTTTAPAIAAYSNTNTECVGGYTWSPTPNSGATLPMRCHG